MYRPSLRELVDTFKSLARLGAIELRAESYFGSEGPNRPRRTWWQVSYKQWVQLGFVAVWEELPGGSVEAAIRFRPVSGTVITAAGMPHYSAARANFRESRRAARRRMLARAASAEVGVR